MSLSDFVIHIDEYLNELEINEAENVASACTGVVSAHINPHHRHLMLVAYDPSLGRSSHILGAVRTLGVHGQLVGL
ncbi:MAG: hypothetical protein Q8L39_08445 [Burkholderiales bacterium]|nr:hypothetical protein [Burkholderiales bacterium]